VKLLVAVAVAATLLVVGTLATRTIAHTLFLQRLASHPAAATRSDDTDARLPADKLGRAVWATHANRREAALALFDFRELTRRAMADHWSTLTPAQQDELVDLLRQVMLRGMRELEVPLTIVKQAEKLDDVEMLCTTTQNGRVVDVELVWRFHQTERGWLLFDLVVDEVSTVRNYKAQLGKIISEHGIDGLFEKLRAKVAG
jgi:phospholipid transport system substrate-binding protein